MHGFSDLRFQILLNFLYTGVGYMIRFSSSFIITLSLLLSMGLISNTNAADIAAGKAKTPMCASCHGVEGISSNPLWPNLAGQQGLYMEKQLKAFRDGQRVDPVMSALAKPLTNDDIVNISAYFASLK